MSVSRFIRKYYLDISVQIMLLVIFVYLTRECEIVNFTIEHSSQYGELQGSGPQRVCVPDFSVAIGYLLFALVANLFYRNWDFLVSQLKDR